MATTQLLTSLFQLYCSHRSHKLLYEERLLLEAILFAYLYQELQIYFETVPAHPLPFQEKTMLDGNVIRGLLNDLLSTGDYSIPGIANYTGFPEDVILDLAAGFNAHPTLQLSRKVIELHALARREFYHTLIKKVVMRVNETAN